MAFSLIVYLILLSYVLLAVPCSFSASLDVAEINLNSFATTLVNTTCSSLTVVSCPHVCLLGSSSITLPSFTHHDQAPMMVFDESDLPERSIQVFPTVYVCLMKNVSITFISEDNLKQRLKNKIFELYLARCCRSCYILNTTIRDRSKIHQKMKVIPHYLALLKQRGKQCSSNSAGDGPHLTPGEKPEVLRTTDVPAYNTTDFKTWQRNFMIWLPYELSKLIETKRENGVVTPLEPATYPLTANERGRAADVALLKAYEARYKERNRCLYQSINAAIIKSTDPSSVTLGSSLIKDIQMFDGVAAFQALNTFHINPSVQNKLSVVCELESLQQQATETAIQFKIRVDTVFQRIDDLSVTFEDIHTIKFLTGLGPQYAPVVQSLALLQNLTIDIAVTAIDEFDKRTRLQSESSSARLAISTASSTKPTENLAEDIATALFSKFQSKDTKAKPNRHSKRPITNLKMKNGLVHDKSKYPNRPTPYERTLTCHKCSTPGHASRTCKKSLKNNKSSRKDKSTGSSKATANYAFAGTSAAFHVQSSSIQTTSLKMIVDSGASHHMINPKAISPTYISNYEPDERSILTAGGSISASGKGSVSSLDNCLLVPALSEHLFSVPEACKTGLTAVFTENRVRFYSTHSLKLEGNLIYEGFSKDGLYQMELDLQQNSVSSMPRLALDPQDNELSALSSAHLVDARPANLFTLWHQRLGHLSNKIVKAMITAAHGVQFPKLHMKQHSLAGICSGCANGKMCMAAVRRKPKSLQTNKISKPETAVDNTKDDSGSSSSYSTILKPGDLILMDVICSPIVSNSGVTKSLIIVDAASRYLWVYHLKSTTQVTEKVKDWLAWMSSHKIPVSSVTTIRTDNGSEFISNEFISLLQNHSIKRERCPPYGHVHMAERANRTVQDTARCMLYGQQVPLTFWSDAVQYAVYILNRTVCNADMHQTRFETLLGIKPNLSRVRTFGCSVWVRSYDIHRKKWDSKAWKGRFIGCDEDSPKTWTVFNSSTRRYINSSNVIFNEMPSTGPETTGSEIVVDPTNELFLNLFTNLDDNLSASSENPPSGEESLTHPAKRTRLENVAASSNTSIKDRLRSSTAKVFSAVTNLATILSARALSKSEHSVPSNYRQAMASVDKEHWLVAIAEEIKSLFNANTFTILKKRPHFRILGLKWVFRIKELIDGTIARFKARCTALGNLQRAGFDYIETFAPTVRYSTIRVLLALAVKFNLLIHNMDVDTAFLYGVIPSSEEIYVAVPPGYPIPQELAHIPVNELVAKCNKSIYGLKQSPRLWNENLNSTMLSLGFTRSLVDPCLYSKISSPGVASSTQLHVAVFVDDIIIAGSNIEIINSFKAEMSSIYKMKDLGETKSILGMELNYDHERGIITLSQSKYVHDIACRFGIVNSNPVLSPLEPGLKLQRGTAIDETVLNDSNKNIKINKGKSTSKSLKPEQYREIVGSLMYLMISTRPDISYSVSFLARYMNCFNSTHYNAAIRLLKYVYSTRHYGLSYHRDANLLPTGYADSDWGSDLDTRRSTTGYVFFMSGGPVSWKSCLQPTVALSSSEAEYMALSAAAQEAIYLRQLCSYFQLETSAPTVIYEDNSGCIDMANNPTMNARTKHIDLRHHFTRERCENGEIKIIKIPTAENIADAFTKSLPVTTFRGFRDSLVSSSS